MSTGAVSEASSLGTYPLLLPPVTFAQVNSFLDQSGATRRASGLPMFRFCSETEPANRADPGSKMPDHDGAELPEFPNGITRGFDTDSVDVEVLFKAS